MWKEKINECSIEKSHKFKIDKYPVYRDFSQFICNHFNNELRKGHKLENIDYHMKKGIPHCYTITPYFPEFIYADGLALVYNTDTKRYDEVKLDNTIEDMLKCIIKKKKEDA